MHTDTSLWFLSDCAIIALKATLYVVLAEDVSALHFLFYMMELKSCSFHCLLVWSGGLLMDYLNFEHMLLEKANGSISEMRCNNSK